MTNRTQFNIATINAGPKCSFGCDGSNPNGSNLKIVALNLEGEHQEHDSSTTR